MVANVDTKLLLLVGISAVLLLTFAFTSFNQEPSLTGQVLGRPPTGASTLDVSIANYTITLDGASRRFTALRFIAYGGGGFEIPGDTGAYRQHIQFYLVLNNQTSNAAPYIGKIVYQTTGGWTNTSTTGSTASRSWINLKHVISYKTANRTLAHSSNGLIFLQGNAYLDGSALGTYRYDGNAKIDERDDLDSSQSGNWSIDFSPRGFGYTYSNLNGSYVADGLGPRTVYYDLNNASFSRIAIIVSRGFVSPAEVNLTILRQFELRLVERANPLATSFNFSCSDSDGNNTLVGGSLNLVYPGRTVELYRDDNCSFNSTRTAYVNAEWFCTSDSRFPIYAAQSTSCTSTCNAEGTACAS